MKKFYFPLDTVLKYKDQVLDSLKSEYAQIMLQVSTQEKKIENLQHQYIDYCQDFEQKKLSGMLLNEMRDFENYILYMQRQMVKEEQVLKKLKKKEEDKRQEVVEAKKEKASIEKLKEKNLTQYNKEYQRSEELFIEEFVSNTRAVGEHG